MDWQEHEQWLNKPYTRTKDDGCEEIAPWMLTAPTVAMKMADIVEKHKLDQVAKEYRAVPRTVNNDHQRQNKANVIIEDIRRIRKHLQSRQRIPLDPSKQTELQKILVNWKETIPYNWRQSVDTTLESQTKYLEDSGTIYTDPKTGLRWSGHYGGPVPPKEWINIISNPSNGYDRFIEAALPRGVIESQAFRQADKLEESGDKPPSALWEFVKSIRRLIGDSYWMSG